MANLEIKPQRLFPYNRVCDTGMTPLGADGGLKRHDSTHLGYQPHVCCSPISICRGRLAEKKASSRGRRWSRVVVSVLHSWMYVQNDLALISRFTLPLPEEEVNLFFRLEFYLYTFFQRLIDHFKSSMVCASNPSFSYDIVKNIPYKCIVSTKYA